MRELIDGHATLHVVADEMLRARAVLAEQPGKLQKCLASLARKDTRARLLMSTRGVGVIVAMTYVAAIGSELPQQDAAQPGHQGRALLGVIGVDQQSECLRSNAGETLKRRRLIIMCLHKGVRHGTDDRHPEDTVGDDGGRQQPGLGGARRSPLVRSREGRSWYALSLHPNLP